MDLATDRPQPRHRTRAVSALALVVAVLAGACAAVGLLSSGGDVPATVVSVHGEVVDLDGSGLYQADTTFKGAANRGSDLVTLLLGVPLLVAAALAHRRGTLRGALLLTGALSWPLYLYATLAVGAAYNRLFLVYVATFAASLVALVLAVRSVDAAELGARMAAHGPRRRLAALMLAGGVVTTVVWSAPLLASAVTGEPPDLLDHQTTTVTEALDLGIITPATLAAAYLLHRGRVAGYLLAFPLLVLMTFLLPMIVAQTVFQVRAGISFTVAEVVGPVAGFLVLASLGGALLVSVLRAAGRTVGPPVRAAEPGGSLRGRVAGHGAGPG